MTKNCSLDPDSLYMARHRVRLTQQQLAARLGVSAGLVGHWERGRKPIPRHREKQLAEALKRRNASQ